MDNQKPIPDYSSPAQERAREQAAEDARRQAIENYNESTFGEPHPIASTFSIIAILVTLIAALFLFLPSRLVEPLSWVAILGSAVWEARKNSRRPRESPNDILSRW
jgi:hypothetical protein